MKCEVAYQTKSAKSEKMLTLGGWYIWEPEPRNSMQAANAVKQILDKKDALLITVKPLTALP